MNIEKVQKAVDLQRKANLQIEVYGEASMDVVDELCFICDNLTSDEESKFIELMYAS
mgnify:CR=1 FL=1